jgi:predicted Kef-type K+ transport protein
MTVWARASNASSSSCGALDQGSAKAAAASSDIAHDEVPLRHIFLALFAVDVGWSASM